MKNAMGTTIILYYIGLYRGILGLYRNNGQENGTSCIIRGLGFRVRVSGSAGHCRNNGKENGSCSK